MWRELGELSRDLIERETYPLRKDDERNPSEDGPRIPSLAGASTLGRDQPPLLVEAQSRRCDSAASGDITDKKQIGHVEQAMLIRP